MREFSEAQKELMALLQQKGLAPSDLFSVMLVLTKEEKAKEMIAFLKETESLSVEDIFRQAGKIAYGEEIS